MSSKVKLSLLMPMAQLALALTLLLLVEHQIPRAADHTDVYYVPTAELLSYGINAPSADLTWRVGQLLGQTGLPVHWQLLGFYFNTWLFLAGTTITWYLVGRRLDGVLHRQVPSKPHLLADILKNAFIALLGIHLFFAVCLHNVFFTNPRNGTGGGSNFFGTLLEQILWLAWAVILVWVSTINLSKALRGR